MSSETTHQSLRWPLELKARVEQHAQDHEISLSAAMCELMERGLVNYGFVPDFAKLTSAEREGLMANLQDISRLVDYAKARKESWGE